MPSIRGGRQFCCWGEKKTGDRRWYKTFVPIADRIYDEYLETLKQEGIIDG